MMIAKNANDGVLTFNIAGRIDSLSATQLEAEFRDDSEKIKEMIFDLTDVSYVSSAGLRVFLIAWKELHRRGIVMQIVNVSPEVWEVFEITGFTEVLTVRKA